MSDRVAIFFWAGSALFGAILTGELYSSGDLDVQPAATVVPASEATRAVQHKQSPPVDDLIATSMDRPLFSATRRTTERAVPNRPADPELTDVRLTGIVIDGDHRSAIFAKQGAKPLVRSEGEMVSNWRLDNVGPRAVMLAGPAGTAILEPKSDPNLVRPARPAPQSAPAAPKAAAPKAQPNLSSPPVAAAAQSPSPTEAQSPSPGAEPTPAQSPPARRKKIRATMPQASIVGMPAASAGMLVKPIPNRSPDDGSGITPTSAAVAPSSTASSSGPADRTTSKPIAAPPLSKIETPTDTSAKVLAAPEVSPSAAGTPPSSTIATRAVAPPAKPQNLAAGTPVATDQDRPPNDFSGTMPMYPAAALAPTTGPSVLADVSVPKSEGTRVAATTEKPTDTMPNVLPSQTTNPAVAPAPPTIPQKVSANTVQPPTTTAQSRSPDDIPVITPKPVVAAPSPNAGTPVIAAIEIQKDAIPIPTASAASTDLPLTATEPPTITRAAVVPQSKSAEPATLLSRADLLLSTGDVTSARLFYQRAADAGNSEAALRLAETYDPTFLDWAKLFTVRADPGAAAFWYGRARELGAVMPPQKTEPHITRTDNTAAPQSATPTRAIEHSALLSRGDSLLNTGDVGSARLFYQRAADSGNGEAALRLGETYDPNFIEWAKLTFVRADPAAALFWYQRAQELGVTEAETLLKDIQSKIATQ